MSTVDTERLDRRVPAHRALFDDVRRWAYSEFRQLARNQVAWRADVMTAAAELRPANVSTDVAAEIAVSVADWTWEHFDRNWTVGDLKR